MRGHAALYILLLHDECARAGIEAVKEAVEFEPRFRS